jgi:hypothetical protein
LSDPGVGVVGYNKACLGDPGVGVVGYNKACLGAGGLHEGSLNGTVDRRE